MSTVTTYKTLGANLSDICNTVNQDSCGDITTGYTQSGTDVGTILTQSTFSTVPGSITASGYNGLINQYNTGESWTLSNTTDKTEWASVAMSSSGQYGLACRTTANVIFYSNNYGQTWTATSSISQLWYSVSISGSGLRGIACGGASTNSKIFYSIDSGTGLTSWIASNGISGTISTRWGIVSMSISGQYCLAGLAISRIYFSNNYGVDWTISSSTLTGSWPGLSISGVGQYAIACQTSNSRILYSYDYGYTWNTSNSNLGLWYLSISSSGQYCIAANKSSLTDRIYRSTDYGKTWNITSSLLDIYISVSLSASGQYAIAGTSILSQGLSTKIVWSIDYGEKWTLGSLNLPYGNWNTLAISGSGQYAIAGVTGVTGSNGGIYYSTNTSTTYVSKDLSTVFEPLYNYNTWVASGRSTSWAAVSVSNTGQYALALDNNNSNMIQYTTDYGANWSASDLSVGTLSAVAISSATGQYGIACGNGKNNGDLASNGLIYYSKNAYGYTGWTGSNAISSTWSSVTISASGQYALACSIGSAGKIYYSTNFGQSWSLSGSTGAQWSGVSISASGQYAIACIRDANGAGKIYYSSNFGVGWTISNAISAYYTSVAISASGQYCVACENANGKIFWSHNYGQGWTTIQSGGTWVSATISSSGQYAIITRSSGSTIYSTDYGVNWKGFVAPACVSVSISGNAQYAFNCRVNSGVMGKCIARNI
jgi:hypothetical protein